MRRRDTDPDRLHCRVAQVIGMLKLCVLGVSMWGTLAGPALSPLGEKEGRQGGAGDIARAFTLPSQQALQRLRR